ncbi:hypothetical protein BDY24DRAFT_54684 [Mrakia frigida]|uniref:uncharacterized protein n=1 Tax=Mrakia frigida TaxID=29902 RepID=UPI003FCC12D5
MSALLPRHIASSSSRRVVGSLLLLLPSSSRSSSSPSHRPFSSSTPPRSSPSTSKPSSSSSSTASSSSSSTYKPRSLPNKPHPAFARMDREREAAQQAELAKHEVIEAKADSFHYYWNAYQKTPPKARLWAGISLLLAGYIGGTYLVPEDTYAPAVEDIKPIVVLRKNGTINKDLVERKEREMRLMREEIRLMRAENQVNEQRKREGKSLLENKAGGKSGGFGV